MTFFQILLISLIQGITEWLPISSSAHLILLPELTDMPDQGPMIDAMAHLGTLMAVLVYFRSDVFRATQGGLSLIGISAAESQKRRLALMLIIATPPGIFAGMAYELFGFEAMLRQVWVIAVATIGFGLLLWLADIMGKQARTEKEMTLKDAFLIGLAQAIAFIPGTSRSGITMTAALALGFARTEAARFSMLLGAPLLAGGGAYAFMKLASEGDRTATLTDGLWVASLSFLAGFVSIWALMKLLQKMSFLPFVIYRLILGGILFLFFV